MLATILSEVSPIIPRNPKLGLEAVNLFKKNKIRSFILQNGLNQI